MDNNINVKQLKQLIFDIINKIENSSVDTVSLEYNDIKLKVKKGIAVAASPTIKPVTIPQMQSITKKEEEKEEENDKNIIKSPIIGVVYEAASPENDAFVKIGQKIKKGDVICIIEAMKVMNEIESDKDGTIDEILFKNCEVVEYGQSLIKLK